MQQILEEVVKKQRHVKPCLDPGVGVVMPFMANGSVLSYLKRERETLWTWNMTQYCVKTNCSMTER